MGWSQRPTGLTLYHPTSTYRGYTLFSPNGGTEAYLVDMEGHFVHRWRHEAGIGYGLLLPNGNFLFRDSGGLSAMPGANAIRELNWDGDLVWEYRNPALRRHNRLANGNNLFLLYEEISEELSRRVQGGFTTPTDPPRMQGDLVAEVTPDGEVVYEWRSSEQLDTAEDMICPLEGRASWGAANDLTSLDDGNFLISFRSLSSVALVDRSSGEFVWKWGPGEISHQHHPTRLVNGNILLLDNGCHRRGLSYSRVIEVDPANSEVVWEYHGDPLTSFFTHFTGGADRLHSGNTLITEGNTGRILEVTAVSEVVWEYINPFISSGLQGFTNGVFRAHRYGPDYPAFLDRDLDPASCPNLNRLYGGGP